MAEHEVCDHCGTTENLAELDVTMKIVRKIAGGWSLPPYAKGIVVKAEDQACAFRKIILCKDHCQDLINQLAQVVGSQVRGETVCAPSSPS